MPIRVKKLWVKFLLALMRASRFIGHALVKLFSFLAIPFLLLWKAGLRRLVFWAYTRFLKAKMAFYRITSPMRRTFFSLFGHRYVVHIMIAFVVIFVSAKNLHARETDLARASQDSLIYSMIQSDEGIAFTETRDVSDSFLNQTFARPEGAATSTPPVGTSAGFLSYDQGTLKPVPSTEELPSDTGMHAVDGEDQAGEAEADPRRFELRTYTVQSGDTIGGIAQAFGVSINTVLWANDMTTRSIIRPGQDLTIPPVTGTLHTVSRGETLGYIANRYDAETEEIMEANGIASASLLQIGQELIIPGGQPPAPVRRTEPSAPTRLATVKNVLTPSPEPEKPPPSAAAEVGTLVWPTDQKRINQYYKWRHPGLDINGSYNNAIYAVDDGTVTFAGWNSGGYGYMILIDHGNGMKTRYAHNSKHFVQAGDQVTKGQTIAMIGSTGRSTGPHIHFELYVNGSRVNPLNYYR